MVMIRVGFRVMIRVGFRVMIRVGIRGPNPNPNQSFSNAIVYGIPWIGQFGCSGKSNSIRNLVASFSDVNIRSSSAVC